MCFSFLPCVADIVCTYFHPLPHVVSESTFSIGMPVPRFRRAWLQACHFLSSCCKEKHEIRLTELCLWMRCLCCCSKWLMVNIFIPPLLCSYREKLSDIKYHVNQLLQHSRPILSLHLWARQSNSFASYLSILLCNPLSQILASHSSSMARVSTVAASSQVQE